MTHRVITISREFGSGGRTIGKRAAQTLGIPCYDQQLIQALAKESGFTEEYVQEQSEYSPHAGWLANALSGRSTAGPSNQDYLWLIQRKVILGLAEKGPCVIVGRCADHILKSTADCLTVFIHAAPELRMQRIATVYGVTDVPTERRLMEKDKRRAAYYEFYTDAPWGQAKNYHLALDSGVLGIDRCAEVVAALY